MESVSQMDHYSRNKNTFILLKGIFFAFHNIQTTIPLIVQFFYVILYV